MRPPCMPFLYDSLSGRLVVILAQSVVVVVVVVVVGAGALNPLFPIGFIRKLKENLIWGGSEFLKIRDPLFLMKISQTSGP